MIFGIKYHYYVGRPFSLEDAFELTSQLKFNHVDLGGVFLKQINARRSVEFINSFRKIASVHGLTYSFHLAYRDVVLLENRRFDVDALKGYFFALNIAREVEATFVTMHPIPLGACRDVAVISTVYRDLAHRAHELGIPLAVENQLHNPRQYPNTVDEFRDLCDNVDNIHFLLDTGHAYVEGGDQCLDAYVTTFGDRLLGLHVSDNHGVKDEHLPVGEGTIDFPKLILHLEQRHINVPLILELWNRKGFVPSKEILQNA
jgi:sugar phosphate isomerase/epimerase